MSNAFALLGLTNDADERAVRQAYARQLKQIDQVAQPQAFMQLRAAFESALSQARDRTSEWAAPHGFAAEPAVPIDADNNALAQTGESASAEVVRPFSSQEAEGTSSTAAAVAQRALEAMDLRFNPTDAAAADAELRAVLARPELTGLLAREAFETQLALRLAGSSFGARRGPLLLAADSVFDWRRAGIAVEPLEFVLDQWAARTPLQRQVLMALLGEPDPRISRQFKLTPGSLRLFETQIGDLASWWMPAGQMQRWQDAWCQVPLQGRAGVWLAGRWRGLRPLLTKMVLGVLLLAIAGWLFNLMAQRGQENEVARVALAQQRCAQSYAAHRQEGWKNVAAYELSNLEACQWTADAVGRRGIGQLVRIRDALLKDARGNTRWVASASSSSLRLNLGDGRAFGFEREADRPTYCRNVREFALRTNWMRLGDVPAAAALVGELAWCASQPSMPTAAPATGRREDIVRLLSPDREDVDALWILLRHTDAWPEGPPPQLPLEAVVRQATPPNYRWQLPVQIAP